MTSETLFALEWDFLLRSNETIFNVDSVIADDIKNELKYNFNDYEKCVNFHKKFPVDNHSIKTVYILAEYESKESSESHFSGFCFPASVNIDALIAIANSSLNGFNRAITSYWYQDSSSQFRVGDYFAIALFAFWTLIVIASTSYECILNSKNKPVVKWLTVFSLHSNILRVFKKSSNFERNVNCLYAIRTLSILWLIVSDRFNVIYKSAIQNTTDYESWIKNGFSSFISSSDAAYDSIFIVSGFLLAIYCFRRFKVKNLNYLSLLLHRYIRYGPLLMISIIYQLTIFRYTFKGPISHKALSRVNSCENYWFISLLMLENFMRPDHMCVYHGWYFSIDFQFFVILPLLVYICHKSEKFGFTIIGVLICISYITMLGVLIYSNTPYDVLNRSSIYDMHSYFRFAPWLLSIVLASLCLKHEYTVKRKFQIINTIAAFLILISLLIYVYMLQNHEQNVIASAIFASFHRIFWASAICWMIFYCYNLKEGDWFDGIINSSVWRPIAKISLALQIVYPIYQHSTTFKMKEPYFFYSWDVFHTGLGDILICVLISLIMNASVEMPFVWIERLINEKRNLKPIRNVRKIENEMNEIALTLPGGN